MSNPYAAPESPSETADLSEMIAGDVRALQIITAGLAQGAIVFGVITLPIQGFDLNTEPDILSWIGVGFAGLLFVLHLVVPPMVQRTNLRKMNADVFGESDQKMRVRHVFGAIRSSHIVACAMLEGPAFMNLIAFITGGWVGNLAIAVVLVVLILLKFPTRTNMSFRVQNLMQEMEM